MICDLNVSGLVQQLKRFNLRKRIPVDFRINPVHGKLNTINLTVVSGVRYRPTPCPPMQRWTTIEQSKDGGFFWQTAVI